MSQLILVRHGQAAAFSGNSDRLTELGRRQAHTLADYWLARDVVLDEVVTGTLQRQIDTEAIVAEAYARAGRPWPRAERDGSWNEYDSGGVTGRLAPILAEQDAAFRRLMEDFRAHAGQPDQNRYFQRMFEALMARWVAGELTADGVEAFADFHRRARAARDRVLDRPGSRRVAVFTSGGPIGVNVQLAVEAPPAQAMQINWRVQNGSLTEFLFSKDRLSLDAFNHIAHLDDPALRSFR